MKNLHAVGSSFKKCQVLLPEMRKDVQAREKKGVLITGHGNLVLVC